MINVLITTHRIEEGVFIVSFEFDDGSCRNYRIEISVRNAYVDLDMHLAYWVSRKYKKACREWLYSTRGRFGMLEARMANVLFRQIKKRGRGDPPDQWFCPECHQRLPEK